MHSSGFNPVPVIRIKAIEASMHSYLYQKSDTRLKQGEDIPADYIVETRHQSTELAQTTYG